MEEDSIQKVLERQKHHLYMEVQSQSAAFIYSCLVQWWNKYSETSNKLRAAVIILIFSFASVGQKNSTTT